jgi:hypothetical protein
LCVADLAEALAAAPTPVRLLNILLISAELWLPLLQLCCNATHAVFAPSAPPAVAAAVAVLLSPAPPAVAAAVAALLSSAPPAAIAAAVAVHFLLLILLLLQDWLYSSFCSSCSFCCGCGTCYIAAVVPAFIPSAKVLFSFTNC